MSSLYDYLKNDKENVIGRITKTIISKLYIENQLRQDAIHECYLAWMTAEYDPLFDNDGIISYAYRCAWMALAQWRRRTLLPVCTVRTERPEPYGIPVDGLHGEQFERFLMAINSEMTDPMRILMKAEGADEEDEKAASNKKTRDDIVLPIDKTGRMRYLDIIGMLSEGMTIDSVAKHIGVNKRTVYRRIKALKDINGQAA